MSQKVREEMLPRLRQRYVGRGRQGHTRMIDELCEQFGYSRKHAIKLLGARIGWGGDPTVRKGRPPEYGDEVVQVLWRIWKVSEQPCGKRLVAMLELWLPHYEAEHGRLPAKVRKQLRTISAAKWTACWPRAKRNANTAVAAAPNPAACSSTTFASRRPTALTASRQPSAGCLAPLGSIRTDNWDITKPGWLEADTVAHCGSSLEGDFIWSVTYTDIFSGWTSLRAVWNKGAHGIVEATREVEAALPFAIEGFDCDNGSEFLNWHLVRYFQERPKRVGFTRSRPYHKNDNGHVEQKNWTHVRQLLGYERLADPEMVKEINRIYRELWEPLHNHFCASAKLVSKDRHGAKVKRRHDGP